MTVEIRRRATIMGAVAVVAALLTIAFVWRTADSANVWSGLITVVLAGIAVLHGFQWWDARTPMLIADERGLRVRLGRGWAGLPWSDIERLEIDEPRRLGDGHVAVFAAGVDGIIAGSSRWARINAATNRLLFDAPLVVPFGLTSEVTSESLAEDLAELADNRCEVVLLDVDAPEEEPTVTVIEPSFDHSAASEADEAVDAVEVDDEPEDDGARTDNTSLVFADLDRSSTRSHWHVADQAAADDEASHAHDEIDEDAHDDGDDAPAASDTSDESDDEADTPTDDESDVPVAAREDAEPTGGLRALRFPRWGRASRKQAPAPASREIAATSSWSYADGPQGGLTVDGVSSLRETSARRDDVTVSLDDGPVTDGNLALNRWAVEERATEPLPEVRELRRRTEDESHDHPTPDAGNIGLVIDATSDISERAMARVLRGDEQHDEETAQPAHAETRRAPRVAEHEVVIGNFLRNGREELGYSVDDLADRTRIRPFVIESLEVDDFSPCGGDFYVRGHLRTLSRVLDLDADELVRRYDDVYSTPEVGAKQVLQAERVSAAGGRTQRRGAPRWLGLAIVVLLLVLVWSLAKYVSDVTVGDTPSGDVTSAGSPGVANQAGVPTQLTATLKTGDKRSKVVVRSRYGEVLFRGMIPPHGSEEVVGAAPLRIQAKHGKHVTVNVDGRSTKVGKDDSLVLRPEKSSDAGE